ncbi:MAG: transcription termination factor Rho [Clostridiales bacterium]|nr:transcription termination factor Rho [Clostridiales bacterium]
MIEKYNTLSLVELKAIVKAQGIKNTSAMRKAQLVQILSDLEEQKNALPDDDKTSLEKVSQPEAASGGSAAIGNHQETKDSPVEKESSAVNKRERATTAKANASFSSGSQNQGGNNENAGSFEGTGSSYARNGKGGRTSTRNMRNNMAQSGSRWNRNDGTNGRSDGRSDSSAGGSGRNDSRSDSYGGTNSRGDSRTENNGSSRNDNRAESYTNGSSRSDCYVRNADERSDSRNDNVDINRSDNDYHIEPSLEELDSGNMAHGILEVMPDGFGFIRCENYLPGDNDIYVSPAQIRRFNLKTGDIIEGNIKIKLPTEKFSALLFVKAVNGFHPSEASRRKNFEDMTPIFPNSRIRLETERASVPMRIVDLVSPIGKGQRGMIVAPPKTGKTTLLKQVAKSVHSNHPDMNMIILLIDERPEEVTDIKEYIEGENVEVIYSTFDELPEHHKRVSEMVLERAKRLVEHKKDVVILLDSITRLARAYNLTVPPSGRTLSGGLDPAALHMPKKFFGAARNMREGGSLTVLATALVETGSKMDDVVFEEFKGTGNMELVLDRKLSEKRIFPAIDIARSGTRREELLLSREELEATYLMRKALGGLKSDEALERILEMFMRTRSNKDFIAAIKRTKFL